MMKEGSFYSTRWYIEAEYRGMNDLNRAGLNVFQKYNPSMMWLPTIGNDKRCWVIAGVIRDCQGVCTTLEIYTRFFLDVIWLKKLKSEEILEIRPAVIELP
jgi:hypothetical protein